METSINVNFIPVSRSTCKNMSNKIELVLEKDSSKLIIESIIPQLCSNSIHSLAKL